MNSQGLLQLNCDYDYSEGGIQISNFNVTLLT